MTNSTSSKILGKLYIFISIFAVVFAILACIPPQDCSGRDFTIKGQVVDTEQNPIAGATLYAFGNDSFEKPGFDITVITDDLGYFESEPVFRYACSEFAVKITADGYQNQEFTFNPPGEMWPAELPEELLIVMQSE